MIGQSAVDRYNSDPSYKRMVDILEYEIHNHRFTPSELREAAILACVNYENKRVHHHMIDITPELHARLIEMNNMVNNRDPRAHHNSRG